ncbi:hypothetical protein MBLNU459_g4479t1 [Dothideomycetes sp. NU459]
MAIKHAQRTIPRISMRDWENRIDEITASLVHAAETSGFFSLTDTSISPDDISSMFATSASFFALPDPVKATVPFTHQNVGWEKNAQVRPSTGVPDMKESYQLQHGAAMADKWLPDAALPGFRPACAAFMAAAQRVSEQLMVCFARGLGFPDDYFVAAHDVARAAHAQTVLRLLHYPAVDVRAVVPEGHFRAGAHADWDFVTLLFQPPGSSGLEICPGREVVTEFGVGESWTPVEFAAGDIVCNIGDLLMSWSDDRFKSTFHRVRAPSDPDKDWFGPRYSIAYFNQPCVDAVIQGPRKKYPAVTGAEFTKKAMERNFAALKAKQAELAASG